MGLFLPRQEIFSPIGLVTQTNQYAVYPSGACKVARNVVMRNPGELIQAPDVQGVQSTGVANNILHKLMPLDGGHVYSLQLNGTTWSVYDINNSATFIGSATGAFSSTGRNAWARVAERLLINGAFGNLVGDFMQPVNAGQRALREAGLPQPSCSGFGITDMGEGWFSDNQMVGYCACFVRTFSDGYELRSSPSPVTKLWIDPASGGTRPCNITMSVRFPTGSLIAGDKVELYRTDTVNTTSAQADPGETLKLVLTYTLTSTDVAILICTLNDRQPTLPGSLVVHGEELYSNPGQEGSTYANRRPPIAKTLASFKGFAFYGHTTERAEFKFGIPGGCGDGSHITATTGVTLETFRRSGIGKRGGTGNKTIGSAVITGVPAAMMVGVVPGQLWRVGTGFNALVDRVLSVTASTITMSAPSSTTDANGWTLVDIIEIDNVVYLMDSVYALAYAHFGKYEVTCSQSIASDVGENFMVAFDFTMERNAAPLDANISVRATNGQNYSPALPEIALAVKVFTPLTRKNRIQWSKEQQPEHAPSASEDFVGFGELLATNETRDAVWHWCTDGLHRLSGHGGALGLGEWQVDYVNSSLIIAGPQASCVYNESLYAYTNDGFVKVDSAGNVTNLTEKVIGDLLPGQKYSETRNIICIANEKDGEILLGLGENGSNASNVIYVFNTVTLGWTYLALNGANLSNITALAMQRSPASGEPRPLFGVSPAGGVAPSYSGWNSTTGVLAWEIEPQPIYGDDPLELKRWIWVDYLFDAGSAGKLIQPTWNSNATAQIDIELLDKGGYARAGCPDEYACSQSISVGVAGVAVMPQTHFQGFSVALKQLTNQSKKR